MATKEEKKEWEVWMLSGKAREIVREILSKKEINVDYYLSHSYTSFCQQHFEDYEWEDVPDYDKSWYGEPDEAFWRILADEWQESLRALKKLPEEERKEKLGEVYHGLYCDGGTFAQHVIARMFYTDTHCSDEVARKIFKDHYFYGDEFISGLHLLDNPQWLTDRRPYYFRVKPMGNYDPIICFPDDLEVQYKNGNTKTFLHEIELMRLDEHLFSNEDKHVICGFLAALLHLIFAHMYCCKMFRLDFAKEEDVERAYELHDKPEIDLEEMPSDLLVPAKEIIEIYFPEAMKRYANKLRRSDKAFDGTEEYTKRKMLEMEEKQQKLVTRAPIWHHIPQDVRDMLLDYHRLFIEFLKKECGIDSNVPDVASSVKKGLFKHITPTAYAEGKAEQVEQELAMASRGTAAQLCRSLRFNASMNYLSIGSLSVTALYNDINEHFGLNYTERNFNKAYSKIPTRK